MERLLQFPAAQTPPRVRITVLGPFTLARNGLPIDTSAWRPRPLALLRLLAVAPGLRRPREEVIDLLWPESSPEAGSANLRDLIRLLRKAFDDGAPLVLLKQNWVALNPAYQWEVDLARFDELAGEAGDDPAHLEAALSLLHGPPLPEDPYADWAAPLRERIERRWRQMCLQVIEHHRGQGAAAQALTWAERWLAQDPLDEAALQQVILLLDALGQRPEALRRARQFADRLTQELDVALAPETEALVEQIRLGSGRTGDAAAAALVASTAATQPVPVPPMILPVHATSFIGRGKEIAAVATLLGRDDVHLLTLTGPGGIGKSRLAVRVAGELAGSFPDGIVFVPLASLVDPDHVADMVAATLGLKETGGTSLAQAAIQYLRHRQTLLLLDNFEHLQAAAPFVAQLIAACPRLRLLITSRSLLQLTAEHRYEVPPLPVPAPDGRDDTEALARQEAVALFVDRARAVRDSFTLTEANAAAVSAICRSLDGLPLALELAAARVRLFPPHALLQQLSSRLALLVGGSRDRPARHQTLRGTIGWSYELLSPSEQLLFARLSVFAGGCGFEAVAAVCNPDGALDLLEDLTSLVDKSLVRQDGEQEPRFSLLETIREYAAEKLAAGEERDAIRGRHAEHYLAMAQTIEPALTGSDQGACLGRLDAELDNLRGALGWLSAHGRVEEELRLAAALHRYWLVRGQCSEGRRWLEDGLARGGDLAQAVRAEALWGLGGIAIQLGDHERGTPLLEEALTLFRALGDEGGCARTLNLLGVAAWRQGAYERAITLYEEGLRLATALGDQRERAFALVNLGIAVYRQGDRPVGRTHLEEALALNRQRGDRHATLHALINLGYDATLRGDLSEATTMFEEVLATARGLSMKSFVAYALENLATVSTLRGDHERAAVELRETILLGRELGDQYLLVYALGDLAKLEVARGRAARAARLGGVVEGLQGQLGISMAPMENQDREQVLERAREELGEERFRRAWESGQGLSLDEAVADALDETAP